MGKHLDMKITNREKFIALVDNDSIDLSNINRQIPALHSTAGQSKAQVLGARLKDINPALDLTDDVTSMLDVAASEASTQSE